LIFHPIMSGKVPMKEKVSFGLANCGTNMLNNVISGAFLKYYTDYIGIDPTLYGLAFMLFAIWNAINDPIFGYISDKKEPTEKGKRLPYIKRSLPLYFLGFYFMVFVSPSWSQGLMFAGLLIGLMVYDTGLAMFGINIQALQTTITDDLKERASISMISSYVNLIPLAVVGLIPVYFYANGSSHQIILIMFFVIGSAGLVLTLIGTRGLKEPLTLYRNSLKSGVITDDAAIIHLGLKNSLKESLKSKSFQAYAGFGFTIAGLTASYFGFIAYYFIDVQAFPGLQVTIISAGGGLLLNAFYPLILKFSKKNGGRKTLLIFITLCAFGYLGLFFTPANENYSFWLVVIFYTCVMIGYGAY
jgi:glycoside/pentoside/hexuronide:cation symporter, GPH family